MDRSEQATNDAVTELRVRIPRIAYWTIHEVFTAALVTYLVFYLIDSLADSFISMQFNMDILLWTVIVSGAASVLLGPRGNVGPASGERPRITFGSVVLIVALGIVSSLVVFIKTHSLGRFSYAVALMSGLTVVLLSLIMLLDDDSVGPKGN